MITKQEIYELILSDFANEYGVSVAELGDSVKNDAAIMAAREYAQTLRIESKFKNAWVGTADAEMLYLFGFGKLGRYPTEAIAGVYECTTILIAGQTQTIPAGTEFRKGNYSYLSTADAAAGANITVRATTAGVEAALSVSDELKSTSPLVSIQDIITVSSISTAAVDAETIPEYRAKVVEAEKSQPSGANATAYRLWAEDVAGIRTVYPYAKDGAAGKVTIYCEGSNPIVPNSTLIDNCIDAFKYDSAGVGRAPVNVFPFITDTNVLAVQQTDINIVINGGLAGELGTAQTVIETYLSGIRPYLATLTQVRVEDDDTVKQSAIVTALAGAGLTLNSVTLKVKPLGGAEQTVTSYQVGDNTDPTYYGEVPILETVTVA